MISFISLNKSVKNYEVNTDRSFLIGKCFAYFISFFSLIYTFINLGLWMTHREEEIFLSLSLGFLPCLFLNKQYKCVAIRF